MSNAITTEFLRHKQLWRTIRHLFSVGLLTYGLLFFIDQFRAGFVSRYMSLDAILWTAVALGVVAFFPKIGFEPAPPRRWAEWIIIAGLTVLSVASVATHLRPWHLTGVGSVAALAVFLACLAGAVYVNSHEAPDL